MNGQGERPGGQTGRPRLVERLAALSQGWVTSLDNDETLQEVLAGAVPHWPDPPSAAVEESAPLIYPLAYLHAPSVTARQFCEITDAACEARRTGSEVLLVGMPLGRARPAAGARKALGEICAAWQQCDLPVRSAGPIRHLPDIADHLLHRLANAAFTRRGEDLADVCAAAAAGALGARRVYLAAHVRPRRNLHELDTVAPLCRLYPPDSPFTDPPAQGKLRPAGSDGLWFLAFTLGLTDTTSLAGEREQVRTQLRAMLGRCWNRLRTAGYTAHQAIDQLRPRPAVRLCVPPGAEPPPADSPLVVPLFGSPTISPSTRALITATAAMAGPAALQIIVDDLTPQFLYRDYDPGAVRARYRKLAATVGGRTWFLASEPARQVTARLEEALAILRGSDLRAVVSRGLSNRRRGGLTGYDIVHLAMMMLTLPDGARHVIAVKASNEPAARRLTRHQPASGLLVCAGLDGPPDTGLDWSRLPVQVELARLLSRLAAAGGEAP